MQHERLARYLMEHSYLVRKPPEEPFILASGKQSYFYFDCDRTISFGPAIPLVAEAFFERLRSEVTCVGGPTRGADPIAVATAYTSVLRGRPVNTFSVRKTLKEHGIPGWVEGQAQAGEKVAFVEDVVTSGGSAITALQRCAETGLVIAQVIVLVDREEQDGMARIQKAVGPDVPVEAIFRISELKALRAEPEAD